VPVPYQFRQLASTRARFSDSRDRFATFDFQFESWDLVGDLGTYVLHLLSDNGITTSVWQQPRLSRHHLWKRQVFFEKWVDGWFAVGERSASREPGTGAILLVSEQPALISSRSLLSDRLVLQTSMSSIDSDSLDKRGGGGGGGRIRWNMGIEKRIRHRTSIGNDRAAEPWIFGASAHTSGYTSGIALGGEYSESAAYRTRARARARSLARSLVSACTQSTVRALTFIPTRDAHKIAAGRLFLSAPFIFALSQRARARARARANSIQQFLVFSIVSSRDPCPCFSLSLSLSL